MQRWTLLVFLMVLTGGANWTWAQDGKPDARLEFSSTSYGFLVGVNTGEGKLLMRDRQYTFTLSAFKVATLGFTKVNALGQVYRLRDLADFPGRYYAVEGVFTLVQGGGHAVLRNKNGVMLYLQNAQQGAELTLGGSSIDIAFKEETASPSAPARVVTPPATDPAAER
jgi:hypothetical protein